MTLSSTEVLYRTLVENSGELIVLIDDDGTLAFVNRACERILGYERREMLGRSLSDFVVIGRMCMEQSSVRTDHGGTVSMRVHPEIGAQFDLGQRVQIVLGQSGRPGSIGDFPARFVGSDDAMRQVKSKPRDERGRTE